MHSSINNKNNPHVAVSGTASESCKRHEPVAQARRSGDCLRLDHGNHGIDVCGFEPEMLFAVDLPFCYLRQVLGKALLDGSDSSSGTGRLSKCVWSSSVGTVPSCSRARGSPHRWEIACSLYNDLKIVYPIKSYPVAGLCRGLRVENG